MGIVFGIGGGMRTGKLGIMGDIIITSSLSCLPVCGIMGGYTKWFVLANDS